MGLTKTLCLFAHFVGTFNFWSFCNLIGQQFFYSNVPENAQCSKKTGTFSILFDLCSKKTAQLTSTLEVDLKFNLVYTYPKV